MIVRSVCADVEMAYICGASVKPETVDMNKNKHLQTINT